MPQGTGPLPCLPYHVAASAAVRGGGGDYNRSGCDPPPSYLSKLAGGGGGGSWGGGGGGSAGGRGGHEATDTWLPNAPVSQATGHCHAKFNQFLVLCINHPP